MKRTLFSGEKHFTASVWILSSGHPKKMLLVHHKKLNKWLQPGGHVDSHENPVETAVREVLEETGLDISFLLDQIEIVDKDGSFLPLPKFLMIQTIPEHEDQPKHFHLDIQYVVEIDEQKLKPSEHESQDTGWFTKEEILKLPIHQDTKEVVRKLM